MITIAYIACFCLFFMSLLWVWYLFLKTRKLPKLPTVAAALLGAGFLFFAALDGVQMEVRQQKASELADAAYEEGENVYSSWYEALYSEEEDKLANYQWDKKNLNLENSSNLETAADMLQNVCLSYIFRDRSTVNSDESEFVEFQNRKGDYLGKVVDLYGSCYQMTDGQELPFSELFSSQNPSCSLSVCYYQYEDREERFIVWRPASMWSPASVEDADYPDGVYIGQINLENVSYDVYVKNY